MKKSANSCSSRRSLCILSAALACAALSTVQSARADYPGAVIQPVAVATPQTGHATVKGERSNVRSRPSMNAEVVAQLHKGDMVEVLERKSVTERDKSMEWMRIPVPATAKCYVSAKHLTDGVVNADNLNVRCGPGSNYRDIGKLPKGMKVEVIETGGEWTQIKPTPECTGWIAAELLDVDTAAMPVIAPAPAPSINTPEVVTPPVQAPAMTAAPAAPAVSVVNIDPDITVAYVVKDGYLHAVMEPNAPASYELRTPEVGRRSFRIAYLESTETNLRKYEGKHVRVVGNQHWRKGDRDPVIAIERLDRVW